jgi:lysozyme family protein
MSIDSMIASLISREGGYSNHPADRGGPTMFGITQEVARAYGYQGDMQKLPRSEVERIYKLRYFLRPGFDRVADIYPTVAEELFDTGVNMGPKVASTFLQRALNALNREGRDYGDIKLDGDCGPLTIQSLKGYQQARGGKGELVMLRALEALQGERYLRLAETKPSQEAFLYGWLANRVGTL